MNHTFLKMYRGDKLITLAFATLSTITIFFSLPITDILYTFVLGNTEKVKNLKLIKKDFSFCVELPIKAKKAGLKLGTNSALERRRIGGVKKVNAFKDGLKILFSMIVLYFF